LVVGLVNQEGAILLYLMIDLKLGIEIMKNQLNPHHQALSLGQYLKFFIWSV
jgi:hypothetical protein